MGTGWRRARNALGLSVCASVPDDLDDLQSGDPRFEAGNRRSAGFEIQQNHAESPRRQPISSPTENRQNLDSPNSDIQSPRLRKIETVVSPEAVLKSSSPRSPSRLNLIRNGIRTPKGCCAICLETMKPGHGHAIFTAECSHSFHFPCIASNVRHGNLICPVCRAKWKEVPWQVPVVEADNTEIGTTAATTPSVRNGNLQIRRRHNTARDEEAALRTAEEEQRRLDPVLRILDDSIASFRGHRQSCSQEPTVYDDDEPLDSNLRPTEGQTSLQTNDDQEFEFKGLFVDSEGTSDRAAGSTTKMRIALHPEVEAVAAGETCENFTVLVHVKAPSAREASRKQNYENCEGNTVKDPVCRAPIDLVTVLDVSGSMSGTKLALLKRAMAFVISNLSSEDRLSVVVFSSTAKRVFPLRRMAPDGQRAANRVVERLLCTGGTNIAEGLRKGAKVLEDRRQRNPVASIMLLSDGQDTYSLSSRGTVLFPSDEQRRSARQSTRYGHVQIPVHAFGFGVDHDAATMHAISEASGGTFSFIQAESLVQDAFAQCIGGLLSVVVQDVRITVSACAGTKLKSFHAGSYETCVAEDGNHGTVNLGDLYAEEERDILVELKFSAVKSASNPMNLISVSCFFKDPISQRSFDSREQSFSILRPENTDGAPVALNFEVEKERNRLRTAQAIAEARTLADQGEMLGAQRVLQNAKIELQQTRTGDHSLSLALEAEITEIQARMSNKQTYERSGRAFLLSAQSSHFRQRATTRGESFESYSREYQTPSMADMVMRSQTLSATASSNPSSISTASSISARRTSEKLAKIAMLRKSCARVSDLHGFENGGL